MLPVPQQLGDNHSWREFLLLCCNTWLLISGPSCYRTANHGALLQAEPVKAGLCSCVVLPTFSLVQAQTCLISPQCVSKCVSTSSMQTGEPSIWKLTQQNKQKLFGIACGFSVKLLFWVANLIFFMFEVAVSEGTGCHVMSWAGSEGQEHLRAPKYCP